MSNKVNFIKTTEQKYTDYPNKNPNAFYVTTDTSNLYLGDMCLSKSSNLYSLIPEGEIHNNFFRGKFLGNSFSQKQIDNIRNNKFLDFFIGDYWEINNRTYIIVDINYFLNKGDTPLKQPHLVIMSDDIPTSLKPPFMYISNNDVTDYQKSNARKLCNNEILKNIQKDFSLGTIIPHQEFLSSWINCKVEIFNETMVTGNSTILQGNLFSGYYKENGINNIQLKYFLLNSNKIISKNGYWLRDMTYNSQFAGVEKNGRIVKKNATDTSLSLRYYFLLG